MMTFIIVWANFALGSNSVKGKARPNVLCEGIRTSEDDHPRRGAAGHQDWEPYPRTMVTSALRSEVSGELANHSEQRLGQIL